MKKKQSFIHFNRGHDYGIFGSFVCPLGYGNR